MKVLNSRQRDFILKLVNEPDFKTLQQYANELKASLRTLSTDMQVLYDYLKDYSLILLKRQGKGIYLEGDIKQKLLVLSDLNKKTVDYDSYSVQQRQYEIIKMMLIDEKKISYQLLADRFLVSKSSIAKDLEDIVLKLDKYCIQISSTNKGTVISGNEEQIQYTLKLFIEAYLKHRNIVDEGCFKKNAAAILGEWFPAKLANALLTILYNYNFFRELPFQYMKSLTITILIYIDRLWKGHRIYIEKELLFEELQNLKTYFLAQHMFEDIAQFVQIVYEKADIEYLNKQLKAHGVELHVHEREARPYHAYVKHAMQKMSEIMEVDMSDDPILYEGLMAHIIPMVYRLHYGIAIHNPLLSDIKKQYAIVFSSTWFVMSHFEKEWKLILSDDEIGFLMVHFQAAIDRKDKVKKILIVCPTGIASSELTAIKIKKYLPSKDVIEIVRISDIYKKKLLHVDLIVSSVFLEITHIPVIYVSPLISIEDIKRVKSFYDDILMEDMEEEGTTFSYVHLPQFINEDYLFMNYDVKSKDEILNIMISQFEQDAIVYEGFKETIMHREQQGSTALDTLVAIPHAHPDTVKESHISILTSKEAVLWGEKKIRVVILIAISYNDLYKVKELLAEIYKLVKSKENVIQMFLRKDKQEFMRRMKNDR